MRELRRLFVVAAACVAALLTGTSASAQPGLPKDTVLQALERIVLGGSDNSTQAGGATDTMWYIPRDSIAGSHPIYSLVNGSGTDHMDSGSTNEGGYTLLGTHGHGLSSQLEGTDSLLRYHHTGTGDHLTAHYGESPSGYTLDGPLGFGFRRYGEDITESGKGAGHRRDQWVAMSGHG